MIADKDRSYYIGASDTACIMRSWETKTFENWYLTKCGFKKQTYESVAMKAGTAFEHRILESLDIAEMELDRQLILGRLRVNLDGSTTDTIYEIKTYKLENGFKVPKSYKDQVQVQMYATGIHTAYIVAYGLEDADYRNFYRDIDPDRLTMHPIEYDTEFIKRYLKRFWYVSNCLDLGYYPTEEGLEEWRQKADSLMPL